MNIKRDSIKELVVINSPLEEIMSRLEQGRPYIVMLSIVKFEYEIKNSKQELTMKSFKDIFYDSVADPKIRRIGGTVHLVDYEGSREVIDLCIFCGGVKHWPQSRDDLSKELHTTAEETLKLYWIEVAKYFPLPPTRVYEHVPKHGDTLFGDTLSWYFCFIYLNDNLGQGIVLSGSTFN